MISQGLQIFIAVVENGSFTQAAKQFYVTPAAIMKQMNALEKRLGMILLKRNNQGIGLTAAGRSVYENGKKLRKNAEEMIAQAKIAETNDGIIIRIGSSFLNPSKALTDLWEPLRSSYPQYKFNIVPFDDSSEHILSWIASVGNRFDVIIGAFNSSQMLKYCDYYEIGSYDLCVAVPKNHKLAMREMLQLADLHGEHLMMVTPGDTNALQSFHNMIRMTHPQILIKDAGYYYDLETFNICEQESYLLLTLSAWSDIHPSLITIPVNWNFQVPYGILYAKKPTEEVKEFIGIIKQHFQ